MKTKILLIALALGPAASAADPAHLVRLYEEEVLAHDLYVALGEKYPDIRPLQNIPHSEARHREVMAGILKAEGITTPKPPEGRRFATEGLDRTFRRWLGEGRKSEVDACRVGVRLEDHDIADLREARLAFPEHQEALSNLEAASNNHLRAFHRNLTIRGGAYESEALPAAHFTEIVTGKMQRGACGDRGKKCGETDNGRSGPGPGAKCGQCGGGGNGPGARGGQGPGPRQRRGPGSGPNRQDRQDRQDR